MKAVSFTEWDQHSYRFDYQLRRHILANLDDFRVQSNGNTTARAAAVALVIVAVGDERSFYASAPPGSCEAALILTKRSADLHNHAGQWALPGGSMDAGETAEQTALRELGEEVGLFLHNDAILGRLDDFITRSGFIITPVVIWGGEEVNLTPNHTEVASIHRIPLTEFMRQDAPLLEDIPESREPVLLMPVGGSWIASPTGAILYQFREVALKGRPTRVSHFEQPCFAWQ